MAGLKVPEDVAILGCENRQVEVGLSPVPLSSVDLNRRKIGRRAAEILDLVMAGCVPFPEHEMVTPYGVKSRESTSVFTTENDGITRSVIHIRRNFSKPLRMSELARIAGMSERGFRDEFKRLVGRMPKDEIIRTRFAAASQLLRDTNLKLEAVAAESGFGSAKKLCEAFTKLHGITPGRWREEAVESKRAMKAG